VTRFSRMSPALMRWMGFRNALSPGSKSKRTWSLTCFLSCHANQECHRLAAEEQAAIPKHQGIVWCFIVFRSCWSSTENESLSDGAHVPDGSRRISNSFSGSGRFVSADDVEPPRMPKTIPVAWIEWRAQTDCFTRVVFHQTKSCWNTRVMFDFKRLD
jgi:hypothetical protein